MTEQQGGQNGGQQGGGTPPEPKSSFTPITSQEELNKVLGDRIARERAKFGDYEDLKAKATKFDEIEQANKSEIDKAKDVAAAAVRERDEAKAAALRLRIAAKHGISDEDADLFLTGADEAALTKQAERLSQRAEGRKRQGNYVPREGSNNQQSSGDGMRDFTRQLFANAD